MKLQLLALFLLITSQAFSKAKVCLTGSSVKIFPSYGEAFYNGATLAAKDKMVIEKHYYDPTPTSPDKAYKKMLKAGCSAILGFTNSNDLIRIKDLARKDNILVISMYGDIDDQLKNYENIRTMRAPHRFIVGKMGKFITSGQVKKPKKVLIVTVVDRYTMNIYKEEYKLLFEDLDIEFDTIDISEKHFQILPFENKYKKGGFDTVLILTRSMIASKIANSIYEIQKDYDLPLILGTANFGSAQLPAFVNRLKNKEMSAYITRQSRVNDPSPHYQEYVKNYNKEFGNQPSVISGLAFDSVNFLLKSTSTINKKNITPTELLKTAKNTTYKGITGVNMEKNLKFDYTRAFIVKIEDGMYELAKMYEK